MIENDVLIAHKAKFYNIRKHYNNNISIVYFSSCDVNKLDYGIVNKSCSVLHSLNSQGCVKFLHTKLLHKQSVPNELFIYGNIEDSLMNSFIELISHHHHNISAVLVVNDVIVGHNPNIQQIALAFQLQPSTTKWVLCGSISVIAFHRIVDVLLTLHTQWIEFDLMCCNIGDTECEIMHRKLKLKNHHSLTLKKLNIPFDKLTVSGIYDLVRVVLMWGVQELNINGNNNILYDCLINNLISGSKNKYKYFLSITYCNKLICFVCNASWDEIVTKRSSQFTELYIINCDLALLNSKEIINLSNSLSRLCVINGTVYETIVIEILKLFSNKVVEISFSNIRITDDDKTIWNILMSIEYCHDIQLNFLLSTDHWLCVCNATENQLHFIRHYFINQRQPDCYGMYLIRKFDQIDGNRVCIFENDQVKMVRLCAKRHQTTGITHVIAALSHATSLNTIDIDDYTITSEAADHLANVIHNNTELQEIRLNGNNLQIDSTETVPYNSIISDDTTNSTAVISAVTSETSLKITGSIITTRAVGLHIATLRKFCISNNNITDEAADDIAAAISCNIYLQELNFDSTNLQTSGAIKITRGLQKISTLTKLCFHGNFITDDAADDIAAAISCNIHLQELNLGNNDFTPLGALKIARSLQKILTLTKLCFHGNCIINNKNKMCLHDKSISNEAINDIATAISNNTDLQELNFSSTGLQALDTIKITRGLQKISSLTKLYINDNSITDEAADDIAAAISCNIHLQELNLGNNNFTPPGASKIARSLQKFFTLTKLCFHGNCINDNINIHKMCLHDKLISNEAIDDLATAISNNTDLQELNLGSNNLQTSGIIKIARNLQEISSLTKLYIYHNNITDEAASDIAAAISRNIHLQELNLGSNNLQASGTIKIARVLQKISLLTKLYINHNNITDEAADDIAAAISCNIKLKEFDISGNNLQPIGVMKILKALKHISTLRKLYISNNNVTDEVVDDIAAAISCNTQIKVLDISGNNLQALGAMRIANCLKHIYTPKTLFISDNNIDEDEVAAFVSGNSCLQELYIFKTNFQITGAKAIIKALQDICTLTKIQFINNNISDEAVNDIAAIVSNNTKLKVIEISGSKLQTSGTIKIMKASQKYCTLKRLYLNDNNITHKAANDIASAVSSCVELQELNLGSNNLQTSGIIRIARTLQKKLSLTKLYIHNNNITDKAADDIAAVISCNTQIEVLDISGNNLQAPGAMKIANCLKHICTPKTLFISDTNDINKNKVAAFVSGNSCLQELYVFRTNFQTTSAKAIIKTLQGICTLTKILFANNSISNETANNIATIVSNNIKLEVIEISESKLQALGTMKIMKALQKYYTLKRLYLNNNNITDKAAGDIAAVISYNKHLQELNLGNNNLQTSGIIRIARTLQQISSLTKLYIHNNNITDKAAGDIAAVISYNIHLQELNLGNNNLQMSGIIRIARTLQKISSLTKLYIHNNNFTDKAAGDIAAAISYNIHLQKLNLGSNNLQTSGIIGIARTLQKILSLKKLYIHNNNITDEAADDIAAAISCNTQIKVLDISGNNLQAPGAMRIAKYLKHIYTPKTLFISGNEADKVAASVSSNSCLQELYVFRTNFQMACAKAIIKTLQGICTLTKVLFADNNISDETANDIATIVSSNTKLKVIEISGSKLQTSGTIKIMKASQKHCTIKRLYLNDNNITEEAADNIASAISFCIDLQELNLGSNNLQTSGIIRIARSLQKISSLIKLYIDHNNITCEAADDIAAAISCNTQIKVLDISGNNLQAPGAMRIAKYLKHICTPKTLFIGDISDNEADKVAASVSSNLCLQELYVFRTNFQIGAKTIIKALQDIYTLTKIVFANNNISDETANDIAAIVSNNTKLKVIEISGSKLQTSGTIKIMKALQNKYTLKRLFLNDNNITEKAADDIASAVSFYVQELNIGGNNLQTSGIIRIARTLQKISSLTKLYIHNNNITDEAAEDIAAAISCNIHLQELNLGNNNLHTSGIITIARTLQNISSLTKLYIHNNNITDEAADDIAVAISCNTHLEELNLGWNNLQTSGIIIIARTLQKITTLTKLYIDCNNITDDAVDDIVFVLCVNVGLQEVNISKNAFNKETAMMISTFARDFTIGKSFIIL